MDGALRPRAELRATSTVRSRSRSRSSVEVQVHGRRPRPSPRPPSRRPRRGHPPQTVRSERGSAGPGRARSARRSRGGGSSSSGQGRRAATRGRARPGRPIFAMPSATSRSATSSAMRSAFFTGSITFATTPQWSARRPPDRLVRREGDDRHRRAVARELARGLAAQREAADRDGAGDGRRVAGGGGDDLAVGERRAAGVMRADPDLVRPAAAASASRTIRSIICTAASGCRPLAVSPESITASAPSQTAFATSEASARVGRGWSIIEFSICVAMMTGFPAAFAFRQISFCRSGTRSGRISTPRSPRATITPSAAAMIASSRSSASGFSIFAMIGTIRPARSISARQAAMSSGPTARTTAPRSRRRARCRRRGRRGPSSESASARSATPGRLIPLCSPSVAALDDLGARRARRRWRGRAAR